MPIRKGLTLGSPSVAVLVGVPYRTLDGWCRTGLVSCKHKADGFGSRREFNITDVVRVRTIAELRRHGVSIQRIRKAVKRMGKLGIGDPLAHNESRVALVGDRLYFGISGEELLEIMTGQLISGPIIQVPLEPLIRDTEEQFMHFWRREQGQV